MHEMEPPRSGGSILRGYLESEAVRIAAHDPEA
jgi:hypothetical protein